MNFCLELDEGHLQDKHQDGDSFHEFRDHSYEAHTGPAYTVLHPRKQKLKQTVLHFRNPENSNVKVRYQRIP